MFNLVVIGRQKWEKRDSEREHVQIGEFQWKKNRLLYKHIERFSTSAQDQ